MIPVKLELELGRPNSWFRSSKQEKGSAVDADTTWKSLNVHWRKPGLETWVPSSLTVCFLCLTLSKSMPVSLCLHVSEGASWQCLLLRTPVSKHITSGSPSQMQRKPPNPHPVGPGTRVLGTQWWIWEFNGLILMGFYSSSREPVSTLSSQ